MQNRIKHQSAEQCLENPRDIVSDFFDKCDIFIDKMKKSQAEIDKIRKSREKQESKKHGGGEVMNKTTNDSINYYDGTAMSRSSICDLSRMTPYKFYRKHIAKDIKLKVDSEPMRIGRAFHCLVLEPHLFNGEYIEQPVFQTKAQYGVDIATQKKDFIASSGNKTILTLKQIDELKNLVEILKSSVLGAIISNCDLIEEEFYFDLDDIDFKAKLDCVDTVNHRIYDVKTCREAFIDGYHFSREMIKHNASEQVYIYSEAYELRYGVKPTFHFLCIEKEYPHETQIWDGSNLYDLGKKRTLELTRQYKELKERYGDKEWVNKDIQQATFPMWAERYLIEDEEIETTGEL